MCRQSPLLRVLYPHAQEALRGLARYNFLVGDLHIQPCDDHPVQYVRQFLRYNNQGPFGKVSIPTIVLTAGECGYHKTSTSLQWPFKGTIYKYDTSILD